MTKKPELTLPQMLTLAERRLRNGQEPDEADRAAVAKALRLAQGNQPSERVQKDVEAAQELLDILREIKTARLAEGSELGNVILLSRARLERGLKFNEEPPKVTESERLCALFYDKLDRLSEAARELLEAHLDPATAIQLMTEG